MFYIRLIGIAIGLEYHGVMIALYRAVGGIAFDLGASLSSKVILCLNRCLSKHTVAYMKKEQTYRALRDRIATKQ